MQKQQDLNKKVRVTFQGELGVDLGGLTKEWFLLLTRKVFHPEYGTVADTITLSITYII